MNKQESKIYQEALEEKKSKLRWQVDLCNLAIAETKKRIEKWLEIDKTLKSLMKTKSQTLGDIALLLNQENDI